MQLRFPAALWPLSAIATALSLACSCSPGPAAESSEANHHDSGDGASKACSDAGDDSNSASQNDSKDESTESSSTESTSSSEAEDSDDDTAGETDITDPSFPGERPACDADFSDEVGGKMKWQLSWFTVDRLSATGAVGVAVADDNVVYVAYRMEQEEPGEYTQLGIGVIDSAIFESSFIIPQYFSPFIHLAAFPDGTIGLVGTGGLVGSDPEDTSKQGIITRKYTREGELVWEHLYQYNEGDGDSWSRAMEVDDKGDVYVSGMTKIQGGTTAADVVFFKLNGQSGCEIFREHWNSDDEPSEDWVRDSAMNDAGELHLLRRNVSYNMTHLDVFDSKDKLRVTRDVPSIHKIAARSSSRVVGAGTYGVDPISWTVLSSRLADVFSGYRREILVC